MLKKILRGFCVLIGCIVGYFAAQLIIRYDIIDNLFHFNSNGTDQMITYGVFIAIFAIIFYFIFPLVVMLVEKVSKSVEKSIENVRMVDVVLGVIGLIIGLILAMLISSALALIPIRLVSVILMALVYVMMAYLGATIPVKRRDEIVSAFQQLQNKNRENAGGSLRLNRKKQAASSKILDTSVIIDGRIYDVVQSGFLEGTLIVPVFVLHELQLLADNADDLKRARGRRGLDIVEKMQKDFDGMIQISEQDYDDITGVDDKLLQMAKDTKSKIVTNDFNLNKVATVRHLDVLNINELANAVKPVVLPGEEMNVTPIKNGKEAGQSVAYLEDGTMIVVENGKKQIGKTIPVTVTSILQTAAGRMIFAKKSHG